MCYNVIMQNKNARYIDMVNHTYYIGLNEGDKDYLLSPSKY